MQHTTNYNLPQWEAADAVKREDVNGAMTAVDAALKSAADAAAAAGRIVLLSEQTTTAQMTDITISLSNIATENYFALFLLVEPPADGSCDYFIYLPDGSEAGCYSDSGSSLERVGMGCNGGALIIRYRPGEQRTHFKELYYRSSKEFTSQGCYCNKPLSQIGSIVARISYSTSIFPAGMHWRLYGVKY